MQTLKAVFFDMDGTILDTEPIHTLAIAKAFDALGVCDSAGFQTRCIGLNNTEMKKLYMREAGSEEEYERLFKLAWEITHELKDSGGIRLKDGFTELSDMLEKRGIKSYIVTSTPRKYAVPDLERTGILEKFEALICFGDYEQGKPHPEPYLSALKMSGFSANECIAVEDSSAGLTSAYRAGLRCILIRDMAHIPDDTAKLAWADLKSLADVIDLLA
jgi:HAD superfamily hydrolase (TIGR01509 family)